MKTTSIFQNKTTKESKDFTDRTFSGLTPEEIVEIANQTRDRYGLLVVGLNMSPSEQTGKYDLLVTRSDAYMRIKHLPRYKASELGDLLKKEPELRLEYDFGGGLADDRGEV